MQINVNINIFHLGNMYEEEEGFYLLITYFLKSEKKAAWNMKYFFILNKHV